jgi:hypothetical protein
MNLIGRLNALKGDEKAAWGKMNVNQMVSHLVQVGTFPFEVSMPDRSNFLSRKVIKPLVLYVMPMPKEVTVPAELSQVEDGRRPQDFEADRQLVVEAISKLGTIAADQDCQSHPFFGKLTPKEWGVLAYKHTDHHLKQFGV